MKKCIYGVDLVSKNQNEGGLSNGPKNNKWLVGYCDLEGLFIMIIMEFWIQLWINGLTPIGLHKTWLSFNCV